MTRGQKCDYRKQINEELLDNAVAEIIKRLVSNKKFADVMKQKINMEAQSIVEYVDVAIGMNTSIGDEAALVFASQFYSSIGFGKNIKTAFDQARSALMLEGIPEETTPELYVRDSLKAEDIVLVKP